MLVDFTRFLFENYKSGDFVEMAVDKLTQLIPNLKNDRVFCLKFLEILKEEQIELPNGYSVNLILHIVCKNNELIELTPTEVRIVEILTQKRGEVVEYNTFINDIWKYAEDNAILKVNISNLRRKTKIPIKSIKGIGYIIEWDKHFY